MTEPAFASADAVAPEDKRKKLLHLLGLVVIIAALGWGVWYWLTQSGRIHTDNAYVGADTAVVTPLISGPVKEVRVGGTQTVAKGDVLVVLDDADAQVDLANAEAMLRQAEQRFRQTLATGTAFRARLTARGADTAQAEAHLAAARADAEKARAALARRESLAPSGAVSQEELATARAAYAQTRAVEEQARAAIATAQATRASAVGELASNEALTQGVSIETAPDVAAARARLAQARLNLDRTVIRAPISGVVTQRQVQVGQRIQAGAPIMTLVPLDAVFVDANFKESQLRDVKPGQKVELTADFYGSDVTFHGTVKGFAGGTGAAFSLIPAQNATGNWVKVVQRLPVRITLDRRELAEHPLRVGLTMTATVDTRNK
ncbi:MAG: HlyD family efflux transporter periplasmic adaptor subunit [Sphingomonadales bacterium]|nr:HlyD family efflux transporter periplasmic adaptor subunit [Sphingomonadales bacterium]